MSRPGGPNRKLRASLWTALDALPKLSQDARARIKEAIQAAIGSLKGISEVWHPLSSVRDGDHANFLTRLRQSERAHLHVMIDAQRQVFNAVAIEYSTVDQDFEDWCKNLEQIAKPFVEQALPLSHGHDDLLRGALSTSVLDWSSSTLGMRSPVNSRETPARVVDRLRAKKSLTLERLASEAGVGVSQIYKIKKHCCPN